MFEPEKTVTLQFYRVITEFLSLVFLAEPDESLMEKIVSGNFFKRWPVVSEKSELEQALNLIDAYCDSWGLKQLEDLKFDYTRLFLGLEKTMAPPYESVFLSEDHLLFEKETLQVRAVYEQFGLKVPRKNEIPDDHLSYELQFVAAMCDMIINALKRKDITAVTSLVKGSRQFLDDHLLKWVADFTDRVVEHSETGFYKGMALLVLVSVSDLRQYLRYFS